MSAALKKLAEGFALIQSAIAEMQETDEWVDQLDSPLGKRAHLEAVRTGELEGRKVKRRVLVRKADIDTYIERHGSRVVRNVPKPTLTEEDEIERILALKPKPYQGKIKLAKCKVDA